MNNLLIGSIVKVTVDHPDGCDDVNVRGDIGVITTIEKCEGQYDYTVRSLSNEYTYGNDQIVRLTDEECRQALYEIIVG